MLVNFVSAYKSLRFKALSIIPDINQIIPYTKTRNNMNENKPNQRTKLYSKLYLILRLLC